MRYYKLARGNLIKRRATLPRKNAPLIIYDAFLASALAFFRKEWPLLLLLVHCPCRCLGCLSMAARFYVTVTQTSLFLLSPDINVFIALINNKTGANENGGTFKDGSRWHHAVAVACPTPFNCVDGAIIMCFFSLALFVSNERGSA